MHQIRFWLGSTQTPLGAYSAPQTLDLGQHTSKGREEEGSEKRGKRKGRRGGKGKRRENR